VLSTLSCPVCSGAIATWAISPQLTCHHCGWALESNRARALAKALLIGVGGEILLLSATWALTGSLLHASGIWLAFSGVLGYGAGYLTFVASLKLVPHGPPQPQLDEA